MGLKAAVQALQKADVLKTKLTRHSDLLDDAQAWIDQQQLQTVYHQVLVLDLEYALDKKVEQELWTLGFKNHISALQEISRDKKNPRRSEYQALLAWCLSAASGFYITLLQELCTVFELDLPFRRRGAVYGQSKPSLCNEQLSQPHASSSIYICQYCLVHLGDVARYRLQKHQAESFYRHAIRLSPTSGHPYNQLALLEASGGDRLATVFHYVRSIAVKNPFPAAAANLAKTLTTNLDKEESLSEVRNKMSANEFVRLFLRVHGLLYLATDLRQAELCVKSINATLTAMVATQSFTSTKLIHMTVINLYALKHTAQSLTNDELTGDELKVKRLVLDMLAGALSAYLLPVYTLKIDLTLLDYYALPAVKLILNWIENEPDVLQETVFSNRLQIWPSLCKLLNCFQPFLYDLDYSKYTSDPLPEDRDLEGFLPLSESLKKLKFTYVTTETESKETMAKVRAKRLINFGIWLGKTESLKVSLISVKEEADVENKTKIVFDPANMQPDPTSELLEEIKHFSINDFTNLPTLEEIKSREKRGGILKPQGSLEKAREEREQQASMHSTTIETTAFSDNSSTSSVTSAPVSQTQMAPLRLETKTKRVRQNVALQAIFKKAEENKQVTFDTESIDKDKLTFVKEPKRQQQNYTNFDFSMSNDNKPYHPVKYSNQHFVVQHNTNPTKFSNNPNAYPPSMQPDIQFNIPPPIPNPPPNIPMPNNQMYGGHQNQSMCYNQTAPFTNQPNQQFVPKVPDYKPWSQDDNLPMPPSTWWPNTNNFNKQNTNYTQYQNQPPPMNLDGNRQYLQNFNTEPNAMPWNPMQNQSPNHGQAMTLRQAMLQETKQSASAKPFSYRDHSQNTVPPVTIEGPPPSAQPSYSLFNSSVPNWSPNLTGQIIKNPATTVGSNVMQHHHHQSLFSNAAVSPLEQLLEQQKQHRGTKNDDT